ncbi:MAG: histidine kinase [Pseudomonadota bacterium]|jgi:two-component system sensor histidine kinase UhpB
MSLRLRVMIGVALLLAASILASALVAGMHARSYLAEEMSGGVAGGRLMVRKVLEDLPSSNHRARDLLQLVAAFDGDRHVQVSLIDGAGRRLAASTPYRPLRPAPVWFLSAVRSNVPMARLPVKSGGQLENVLELRAAPEADAADLWQELADTLAVLTSFSALAVILVWLTIGRALRPLDRLAAAFQHIGAGDYRIQVAETGPSELLAAAKGFNRMAGELATAEARTRQLEAQIATLQDEERAEVARDLHDEIGPYLFAVNLDAVMVERLSAQGRSSEILERTAAIKAAVEHMQRQVRELLGRLRPPRAVELGLCAAVQDLAEFWRARTPQISFSVELDLDDEALAEPAAEAAYRMVQEGLSNAVRHGRATRIVVRLSAGAGGALQIEVRDDGPSPPSAAPSPGPSPGHGLRGMRERIAALGGQLDIGAAEPGRGWRLRAFLPAANARPLAPDAKETTP